MYMYLRKSDFDQLLDFTIFASHFIIVPYFTLWMPDFFNTIRVPNSLDPDQSKLLSDLIWVQTVCKAYQQTTKVSHRQQRVKYKTT